MKDKTISAIEADTYVRLAFRDAFLWTNVEPKDIMIGRYKKDSEVTGYYISYTLWDSSHAERNLMSLDGQTFFSLMKKGLELKGYDVGSISELFRDESYYYKVRYRVAGFSRRRK